MIPFFTAIAGLVYCAIALPALIISIRRGVSITRVWAVCTVIAAAIVLNAIGGQEWLSAAAWTGSGGLAAWNWRQSARRDAEDDERERIDTY